MVLLSGTRAFCINGSALVFNQLAASPTSFNCYQEATHIHTYTIVRDIRKIIAQPGGLILELLMLTLEASLSANVVVTSHSCTRFFFGHSKPHCWQCVSACVCVCLMILH